MQLGMIGLGRMGANIVRRIVRDEHTAVAYDTNPDTVDELAKEDGVTGAKSLEEFVQKLDKPRVAWVMIPAGITDKVVEQLSGLMESGDIIINGGNSNYREDYDRAKALKENQNIEYLDVGTSGGVWGLDRGYCLMIGGDEKAYQHCEPLFASIAPGAGDLERTPGRKGDPAPEEQGYLRCGEAGSGHFVKMVHNGIEYGMMAAYAEGLNVLHKANAGKTEKTHSAEETPLEQPEYYRYDIDLAAVSEVWRRGSVIASWLLDLTAGALQGDPNLEEVAGRVSDSGEGRWTIKAGIDEGVPTPVLAASLFARFSSRGEAVYADKLLSAMRKAFGGHNELPTGE
jgi:6-phosphogluconate dehydrogenase